MRHSSPEVQPSQVTFKTVFTVCGGVLIVAALVWAASHAVLAITLTIMSALLAVALDHVVSYLERLGVRRMLAIVVVTVLGLALLAAFGFTVIPAAISQGKALAEEAPQLLRDAQATRLFRSVDAQLQIAERLEELQRRLPDLVEGAASPLLTALGGVLTFAGAAMTIGFVTIFMLVFGARIVRTALDEARVERRATYARLVEKIYGSIGGYLGGLMLICTINATLTSTFLAIVGVTFFLPLGILSGFSSTVPYAGPAASGIFISLLATVTGGVWHGVASLVYFVAYGQLEGNVLAPLVFRRTVHVNPLVVLLSVLFFGEMAGVMGAIVAVPVVAAGQIVLREVLRVRREHLSLQRAEKASLSEFPPSTP